MINNSPHDIFDFDKTRKIIDSASRTFDEIMNDLPRANINQLKHIVNTKVKNLYDSASQIEYILMLSEGYKQTEIEIIDQLNEDKGKRKIEEEFVEKEIAKHKEKIRNLYFIVADFKKLQIKIDFLWNFISWRYTTLLSESIEKLTKRSTIFVIAAAIIALISLIIGFIH